MEDVLLSAKLEGSDFASTLQALLLSAVARSLLFKKTNYKCSFPTRIKVLELLKDLLLVSLHQVTLPLSYTVCHLGKQVMEGRHCRFLFGREGELGETGVYKNLLSL